MRPFLLLPRECVIGINQCNNEGKGGYGKSRTRLGAVDELIRLVGRITRSTARLSRECAWSSAEYSTDEEHKMSEEE